MTRCRVCHRILRDAESAARGIGPTCNRHHSQAAEWIRKQGMLFEEPKEVEDVDTHGPVLGEETPSRRISMVAEDLEARPVGVVAGAPMGMVSGPGPIIRWPIRVSWWRRVLRWLRHV